MIIYLNATNKAGATMTTEITTTNQGTLTTPDRNPAVVYLASLRSPRSQATMKSALNAVANLVAPGSDLESFAWGSLRYSHTQAIRALLASTCGAPTANQRLAALRGTLKAAWRLGYMNSDEYQWAVDFELVRAEKPDQAAGRALGMGEIMALVASCADGSAQGHRDAAILAVAYACGLRRSEIVNLDLEHFSAGAGVLTVAGKGGKTRTVPIQNGARGALGDWLAVRGSEAGPLFWHVKKGGAPVNRRLTPQAVYVIFAEHAAAAGVESFSPHDLRRTFATRMAKAGVAPHVVEKMLNHSMQGVMKIYNRHDYAQERVEAAKLWTVKDGKLVLPPVKTDPIK